MGLDTTHDCWHGPYSMFMRWRIFIAKQVGIPLLLMEGFYKHQWTNNELDFDRDYYSITRLNKSGQIYWETLDGFSQLGKPISWEMMESDPLTILLKHSDCDGKIKLIDCLPISFRLEQILKKIPHLDRGTYNGEISATKQFIAGLKKADCAHEDVLFH